MKKGTKMKVLCRALLVMFVGAVTLQAEKAPETSFKTTKQGFVCDWLKLGPIVFGHPREDPFQKYPINYEKMKKNGVIDPTEYDYLKGEWEITPKKGDKIELTDYRLIPGRKDRYEIRPKAKTLVWEPLNSVSDRINLDRKRDYELNYLVTYIWSPREIKGGAIYVGSDDFVQIFVNGKCVHVYKSERRGLSPWDEVINVDFKKGWNVLNLKVVDVSHGYEFFCCLVDDTGTPMRDYPISLTPPRNVKFADKKTALESKEKMQKLGQEKIPPEKANFDPAIVSGANYPLKITFEHDGEKIPTDKRYPMGFAVEGQAKPVKLSFLVQEYMSKKVDKKIVLPKKIKIVAELFHRDKRAGDKDITKDTLLDSETISGDVKKAPVKSKIFSIPTDKIGFYGLEVSVFDNGKLVRYSQFPIVVISKKDFQPKKSAEIFTTGNQWKPGDWKRWGNVVVNKKVSSKVKFWPILVFNTGEIVSPIAPNMLEGLNNHGGLGHITPTPKIAPAAINNVRDDWSESTFIYDFNVDGKNYNMDFAKSKVTMSVYVKSAYNSLTLFAGLDELGLGQPSKVAYRTKNGKIAIKELNADFSPNDMGASWLLFWFDGKNNWNALDIPALVVLQHQPEKIISSKPEDGCGITLKFKDEMGAIVATPLLGSRIVYPEETAKWGSNLPDTIVAECDFLAKAMRNYPVRGKDKYQIAEKDIKVAIDYEFLSSEDDWGTKGIYFAPYPYWVSLAAEHPQSVVKLSPKAHKTKQLHPFGLVYGVPGSKTCEYTLTDLKKYIDEVRTVTNVKKDGKLKRAFDDLKYTCTGPRFWVLSSMSNMGGDIAKWKEMGNFTYGRLVLQNNGGHKFGQHCFENEGSMITNVSHALQYLPEKERQQLKAFMMRFMEFGTRPERYVAFDDGRLMFEDVQWFISRFMIGAWSYGYYTGHWQLIRDRWPLISAEFSSLTKNITWENLKNAGSEESNLLYQAMISYARMAKELGKKDDYQYATYCGTRMLAIQQTIWMLMKNDGHQTQTWYAHNFKKIKIDSKEKPQRPALFFYWMLAKPLYKTYNPETTQHSWHATVDSPFSYPYLPTIMRFQTDHNEPLIKYYMDHWDKSFPEWYKGLEIYWPKFYLKKDKKTGKPYYKKWGWGVYFNSPEYFASRGWMNKYTGETSDEMMDKYLQNMWWGVQGPKKARYEFNNRGWMSLPKALISIIEASGDAEYK